MAGNDLILHEPRGLARLERLVRRHFWARLGGLLVALPFAELVIAAYFCVIDRRTPAGVKLGLLTAIGGLVVPMRFVPRALRRLVIGGDALGVLSAIQAFGGYITPEHRLRAREVVIRRRRERAA